MKQDGRISHAARLALVLLLVAGALWLAPPALAQGDRGTITGTVTDASGATVPNAKVTATNTATGVKVEVQTTEAGDYTIPDIPAGQYDVSITATGFKQFVQKAIKVEVAIAYRVNARLEVGAMSETVEVTGAAPLLQTESSEESENIAGDRVNSLPLNFGGGAGNSGAIRDPTVFILLLPGVGQQGGSGATINGLPSNTWRTLYAGQDATASNSNSSGTLDTQGSVEMIQEYTVQGSNFAPEYGGATSALINYTPRSGSNRFHGGLYEYLANSIFDASQNYQTQLNGTQVHPTYPVEHKHDFGGTVGGPVWIPKIYDGHNKTFFFFNLEFFHNNFATTGSTSVPTLAERSGDFSAVMGQTGVIGTDVLGRSLYQNEIFDPSTVRTVNGHTIADPWGLATGQLNVIPMNRMDPVALAIQKLIPLPTNNAVYVNNYVYSSPTQKKQRIWGFTVDQAVGNNGHMSFYLSHIFSNQIFSAGPWPVPLTQARYADVPGWTIRLNHTQTITPSLVLQAGIGYLKYYDPDSSPDSVLHYDAAGLLGLKGAAVNGFPLLNMGASGSYGGSSNFGPTNANHYENDKATGQASLTWARGSHTLKLGSTFALDTWGDANFKGSTGVFNFGGGQTGNFDQLQSLASGGGLGFSYASFLLGLAGSATTQPYASPYVRRRSWALFLQDSWRATPKLTLTYGLRWDYNGWPWELHNRQSEFSYNTLIPSLGNIGGGIIYEGNGPGRCNCSFVNPYPFNIAPRLGAAYQLDAKTVLRGGFGVTYGQPGPLGWFTNNPNSFYGVGWNVVNFQTSTYDGAGAVLSQGLNYNPALLTTATIGDPSAGAYIPTVTSPTGIQNNAPYIYDPNANMLPRILEYNLSIQRQLTSDMMLEAAYVGNLGVREQNSGLVNINSLNPAILTGRGIDPTSPATITLLNSTIGSAAAKAAGFTLPYPTFPTSATVAQSLRPYPEYGSITNYTWAPLGKSKYDSLQMKLTKRSKYGLTLTSAFTWSKTYSLVSCNGNVWGPRCMDLAGSYQPFIGNVSYSYEIPKLGSNKLLREVIGGWTFDGIMAYGSGSPLGVPGQSGSPTTNTILYMGSRAVRVPGVPLYLVDINCHCYDPSKQQVLNPAAWTNPPVGTFAATTPYYDDFLSQRRPNESMSFGRRFRIKETKWLQIRAEFFNVFNRTEFGGPSTGQGPITYSNGLISGGFGTINIKGGLATGPRNGQVLARLTF